jgi:hypothetical protein
MDYETFTRDKIVRLRAEADALEKTLKEFQAATARASAPSRRTGPQEGSAFGAVMDLIQAAGTAGMTLDEMIEQAAVRGYEVKRNTLRSQLWQAKKEGRVIQYETGRYAFVAPPLDFEDNPPEPEPENQGFSGGFQRRQPTGPRESFSADMDDEIPF